MLEATVISVSSLRQSFTEFRRPCVASTVHRLHDPQIIYVLGRFMFSKTGKYKVETWFFAFNNFISGMQNVYRWIN